MNSTDIHPSQRFDSVRLSHAYIVPGSMAKTIAMAVVCSDIGTKPCMKCAHCGKSSRGIHPDISVISKPDKKREIIVDQIRELKRDVIVIPNESEKKAYIIKDADLMNISAQNAFLRILEEPPTHAVFILQTDTPAELLTTVRSRCVEIKSHIHETPPDTAITEILCEFFSAISGGSISLVEFMFRLESLDKSQFSAFLAAARLRTAAELIESSPGRERGAERGAESRDLLSHLERTLVKAGEYLDFNVSVGHISGMICANLIHYL